MAHIDVVALPGDGIGPEVTEAVTRVLAGVASAYGHERTVRPHDVGWAAYERHGTPLPDDTLQACVRGPAVFLGAVGDPQADGLPPEKRPEAALLRLRRELGCFANLRPAKIDEPLVEMSALRPEVATGTDLVIVRELTGGIYYGTPRGAEAGSERTVNTLVYTEFEVERIARIAFETARRRRGRLTSIDKANVLEVSQLWRAVVERVASDYPDVAVDHMFVDRAAMELVTAPTQFDVVLTAFNYSLLWQEALHAVLPEARRQNMGIVVGSPLQQGALSRIYRDEVEHGARWLSPPRRAQYRALYAFVDELGIGLPELALRFVLSNPDISCTLTGARSVAEVEMNVAAAERGPLPDDILARIAEIAAMVPFRPFDEPFVMPFGRGYRGPGYAGEGAPARVIADLRARLARAERR